jgi:D-arabinose 1-dehydrogenase-like Zn-dependent alcohol dehydrogenase
MDPSQAERLGSTIARKDLRDTIRKEEALRAVRFVGVGRPAQIEDVRKPSPGPGQVLIKIGGAGVCHSDLHVMEDDLGFKPPFTPGHENPGYVSATGEGVMGFKEGDPVAVYGPARALCATAGSAR